jgi:hypothetical protein
VGAARQHNSKKSKEYPQYNIWKQNVQVADSNLAHLTTLCILC